MTLKISLIQKTLIILFIMCISLFSQEYEEAKKYIVSLIDNLNSKNKLEMNNQNYDYIYKEIIFKYDNTIKKLKKKKEEQKYLDSLMEAAKYELDINRHKYLENQMKKIEKIKSVTQIDKMINEIYHNSTRGYEKGFIFDKSYKSYWEDIKKDYLKNLKQNNMNLVKNDIFKDDIFKDDITLKYHFYSKIKYRYEIEENIHYVNCYIYTSYKIKQYDEFFDFYYDEKKTFLNYHIKFKIENIDSYSIEFKKEYFNKDYFEYLKRL